MKKLKAQFKDQAGLYTMTWSYNEELWEIKDLIKNECLKSNSKLVNILSNEKSN
jgi:hypothetical protein